MLLGEDEHLKKGGIGRVEGRVDFVLRQISGAIQGLPSRRGLGVSESVLGQPYHFKHSVHFDDSLLVPVSLNLPQIKSATGLTSG